MYIIANHTHKRCTCLTVKYEGRSEPCLFLSEDLEVEEGTVTNLVIIVHQTSVEEDEDAR